MHLSLDTLQSTQLTLFWKKSIPLFSFNFYKKITLPTKESINSPGILQKLETPIPKHLPLAKHNWLTYCFAVSVKSVYMSCRLGSFPSCWFLSHSSLPWRLAPWPTTLWQLTIALLSVSPWEFRHINILCNPLILSWVIHDVSSLTYSFHFIYVIFLLFIYLVVSLLFVCLGWLWTHCVVPQAALNSWPGIPALCLHAQLFIHFFQCSLFGCCII